MQLPICLNRPCPVIHLLSTPVRSLSICIDTSSSAFQGPCLFREVPKQRHIERAYSCCHQEHQSNLPRDFREESSRPENQEPSTGKIV